MKKHTFCNDGFPCRYQRYRNNTAAAVATPGSPDSDEAFSQDEVLKISLAPLTPATAQGPPDEVQEMEAWMAAEGGEAALLAMIGEEQGGRC